jgi:hypothetical protein
MLGIRYYVMYHISQIPLASCSSAYLNLNIVGREGSTPADVLLCCDGHGINDINSDEFLREKTKKRNKK